jgi:DNA-3-methyladenine glycosylase
LAWREARPLPREFYARGSVTLARALLGRVLVRREGRRLLAGRIVEVEAYRGSSDPASHAYRGPTPRNRVMFGPAGHGYVYFVYGVHHCLNVVAAREGVAEAVLLRALEPLAGLESMRERRGDVAGDVAGDLADERLMRGPGCVARALGLTRADDGVDLVTGALWIAAVAAERGGRRVASGPRIGIRVGVESPWRFWLAGHPAVSGPRGAGAESSRGRVPR